MKTEDFGAKNKPVLCLVYADYCTYCKTATPAFKQVHDAHKQKKVFLCGLQTDDQDPLSQELMRYFPQILKANGVKFNGVPTYIVYKNGKYSEYSGGRDADSLMKFIESL
jgi:thiol:disulfide interchange protein